MRIDQQIPKEYHPLIISYLKKTSQNGCDVKFDEKKQQFVSKTLFIFTSVSEKEIVSAWQWIQEQERIEQFKEQLQTNYGGAVNYFFNDARIDEKGIFLNQGFLRGRKYFTLAELDDLLEKYQEKTKL